MLLSEKIKSDKILELLLFIDSLFTETATSFLIPHFNKNIFNKKTAVKVWVYLKSSVFKN